MRGLVVAIAGPEVALRYMQGTSPLVKFVQITRWRHGALQTADLALRQAKPPTDVRLREHWPMLMTIGVEHLAEVPSRPRLS